MKNLKYMSLVVALLCVFSIGFTACSNDDDGEDAPAVAIDEANIEGDILCVQADVMAPGRTANITIGIYDSTGKTLKATQPVTDSKYIGVLNIDGFHVHVSIAGKGVVVGDMLKLTVVDANGRSATAQKSITEEEEEEPEYI